ncbi:MAG: glycosyltransferase family 2 protein [Gemmatimonadetes bacterium]|nr:glycosyltransferase family 2 protein [Gemmatimonadota bacterium]
MTFAYWVIGTALALGVYTYAGYPLLLIAAGALRRPRRPPGPPAEWPMISITIPVYNEEAAIAATLDRVLELDYPEDRRQVLVVSDASTDRTDEIVAGYADRGVELIRLEQRSGKTAAENAARPHLKGELIVNTDASIRIHREALKPLVATFADPSVGVASGRDVSVARMDDDANLGESGYVGYEMWIRRLETGLSGIVGASGCFYANRVGLHMTLVPEALSRDFAAALIARENGFRSVSVDQAVCFVPRLSDLHREYRRKVRTITRGIQTLYFKRHLLNPFRFGVFSWMLVSHKVCRWVLPWVFTLAGLGILTLAVSTPWAFWPALAMLGVLGLGWLGWVWPAGRHVPWIVAVPTFAVAGNVAAMQATVQALRGELSPIWEPTRREMVDAG